MQDPSPRYAVITGAGSGLGRAFALRLARDGWRLAIADVHRSGLEETARLLDLPADRLRLELLDVARPEEWSAFRARLQADWPHCDLLINNAGVAGEGEVGVMPLADWEWILRTNLHGVVYGCHEFVGWLAANPRGARLINIASVAGMITSPAMAAYCASKAGVIAVSEALRAELLPRAVRVTVACPGFFPTNLLDRGRFGRESRRDWARRMGLKNRVSPDDVAAAVLRASERGRLYAVLPLRPRLLWYFKRLAPAAWVRLVSYFFHRSLAGDAPEA